MLNRAGLVLIISLLIQLHIYKIFKGTDRARWAILGRVGRGTTTNKAMPYPYAPLTSRTQRRIPSVECSARIG